MNELEADQLLSDLSIYDENNDWNRVSGRDVLMLGGVPLPPPRAMIQRALPDFLQTLIDTKLQGIWGDRHTANHVLVNRYDAQSGIAAHTDGPLYAPRVAIVSLCTSAVMDFGLYEEIDGKMVFARKQSVFLPPRSLLIFDGAAYTTALHTIQASPVWTFDELTLNAPSDAAVCERSTTERRVSLTIRVVQRTLEER